MTGFSGGEAVKQKLLEIAKRLGKADLLKVGFLEGATYPDGTNVAMVAATQEFGGEIEIPERTQEIYFNQKKRGSRKKIRQKR